MASTRIVLAGVEAAYNTDPVLTPAANAILTTNFQVTPLEADTVDRNLDTDQIGNSAASLTGKRVSVGFGFELAGSGAAGTAPAYGPILRACGFAETIDLTPGSENVTYDMINDLDTAESAYLYAYWLGKLHKLGGARGSAKFTAPSRNLFRCEVSLTGIFVPVSEATPAAADYSAFKTPLEVGQANSTIALGAFVPELESFDLDIAHNVKFVTRVGRTEVEITEPAPSGQMTIKTPLLASKDFFADAGGAASAFAFQNGSAAGSIVQLNVDQMQTLAPSYVDLDSTGDGLQVPLRPIGNGIHLIVK